MFYEKNAPPPHFWPFLAAGWCFFMFFLVFFCFFMVVLGTSASCGTKEALFFQYFWHSVPFQCFALCLPLCDMCCL